MPSEPGLSDPAPRPPRAAPRILESEVAPDEDGQRFDRVAAARLPRLSRSEATRWIAAGLVLLDGRERRPSRRCRAGQRITIRPVTDTGTPLRRIPGEGDPIPPEPIPLTVIHEDAWLVVLDKQAGIVVHPGPGHPAGTIANGLLHRYPEVGTVGPPGRPGLVHRLDRGTSGLLVAARRESARLRLAEAFARREVEKHYLALALGRISSARLLADPIGRDPRQPQRYRCRGQRAKDARSEVWPVEELPLATLVRIRLHTGRTHQARVHLAGMGHPLAGDALYGPAAPRRGGGQAGAALRRLKRPALHAAEIAFVHPGTGEPVRFRSPLSEDLEAALRVLRRATATT